MPFPLPSFPPKNTSLLGSLREITFHLDTFSQPLLQLGVTIWLSSSGWNLSELDTHHLSVQARRRSCVFPSLCLQPLESGNSKYIVALEVDCLSQGSPEKQNYWIYRKRFTIRNWLTWLWWPRSPRSAVGKLDTWQANGAAPAWARAQR